MILKASCCQHLELLFLLLVVASSSSNRITIIPSYNKDTSCRSSWYYYTWSSSRSTALASSSFARIKLTRITANGHSCPITIKIKECDFIIAAYYSNHLHACIRLDKKKDKSLIMVDNEHAKGEIHRAWKRIP